MENFNYVIRKFPDEPTRYEALVWLLRCFAEQQRYDEAIGVQQEIDGSMDFPKKLDQAYALALADLQLKRLAYEAAIPPLESALNFHKLSGLLPYLLPPVFFFSSPLLKKTRE